MKRFRARRVFVAASLAALLGAACDHTPDPFAEASGGTPQPSASFNPPVASLASPTPPALPAETPPKRGAPAPGCVDGWMRPAAGSRPFTDPIGIIRRTSPWNGPYQVVDMRMFVGPESPPSDKGYITEVRRWYVKLFAPNDLTYQGRFLVEERVFGRGLSAVAPYDTHGFQSPDWSGFQYKEEDPTRVAYAGLPGAWAGLRYNFVDGGAGIDIPGLPDQVRGCLTGT